MTKEMNKNIFAHYLEKAITELKAHSGEEIKEYIFTINPVLESGKSKVVLMML